MTLQEYLASRLENRYSNEDIYKYFLSDFHNLFDYPTKSYRYRIGRGHNNYRDFLGYHTRYNNGKTDMRYQRLGYDKMFEKSFDKDVQKLFNSIPKEYQQYVIDKFAEIAQNRLHNWDYGWRNYMDPRYSLGVRSLNFYENKNGTLYYNPGHGKRPEKVTDAEKMAIIQHLYETGNSKYLLRFGISQKDLDNFALLAKQNGWEYKKDAKLYHGNTGWTRISPTLEQHTAQSTLLPITVTTRKQPRATTLVKKSQIETLQPRTTTLQQANLTKNSIIVGGGTSEDRIQREFEADKTMQDALKYGGNPFENIQPEDPQGQIATIDVNTNNLHPVVTEDPYQEEVIPILNDLDLVQQESIQNPPSKRDIRLLKRYDRFKDQEGTIIGNIVSNRMRRKGLLGKPGPSNTGVPYQNKTKRLIDKYYG